jgi:hypothetical protein
VLLRKKVVARFFLEAIYNLLPRDTGVEGAIIWVSDGEFSGVDSQHRPRIKVVLGNKITTEGLKDSVSVRITNPPVVLGTLPGEIRKQVIRFVNRNRGVLLQHWNGELGSKDTMLLLESL